MYSSAKDIATFGAAILNFDQLSAAMTRRWLKPFSYSSDPKANVGAPWGARRIELGPEYRQITAYNKAGAIGDYSGLMVLIPDYNIGFSVMLAGALPGNANFNFADILGDALVPAIEQAAKNEAAQLYAGTFSVPSNSSLNSSMTVEIDEYPGLSISQWFSNGTDFREIAVSLYVEYTPITPSIRLYPTGLQQTYADGSKRVVFKAIFEDLGAMPQVDKMFSTDCGSWIGVESVIYASVAVDGIIFHVNAENVVTAVESPALRIVLDKTS
jgi:hypothetical protein